VRKCLDSGVSVAAIHYRFLPDARIAEIMRDSARALQFMRFKANEWNIDKKRVASYGGSAGAGTSLWLAAHDDLADPKNADPVLRESTRLTAAGSLNGQFTYDFRKWEEVLGKDPDRKYEDGDRDKLYRQWYGLSQAEVEQDGSKAAAVLADADMRGMLTKDDAPLFVYCPGKNSAPENHGHYIHHPRHSIAIKEKCDAVGIECELALKANDPKLSGGAANERMLKFFFKHLNVK
jgi:acetyl esterase/lipase